MQIVVSMATTAYPEPKGRPGGPFLLEFLGVEGSSWRNGLASRSRDGLHYLAQALKRYFETDEAES